MSVTMSVAWDLLNAIAIVQQRLAAVRPFIWQRTKLATAEHTEICRAEVNDGVWRPAEEGDHIVVEVSIQTRFQDGRFVSSYLEIIAQPDHWQIHPYIGLMDQSERLLWEGPTSEPKDVPACLEAVDAATKNLVNATIRLDYDRLKAG